MYKYLIFFTLTIALSSCVSTNDSRHSDPTGSHFLEKDISVENFAENFYTLLVGEMALVRGQNRIAYNNFLKIAENYKNPEMYRTAVALALGDGYKNYAVIAAMRWAEQFPESIEPNSILAQILLSQGRYQESLDYFEAVIDHDESIFFLSDSVPKLLAECATKEAVLISGKLLELDSARSSTLYLRSLCHRYRQDMETAVQLALESVALDEDYLPAHVIIADAWIAQGRHKEGLQLLLEQAQKHPDTLPILLKAAYEHFRFKRDKIALDLYQQSLDLDPEDDRTVSFLLALNIRGKNWQQLPSLLGRYQEFPHRADRYYLYSGQFFVEALMEYEKAVSFYSMVSGDNPGAFYEAQVGISRIYQLQGKLDQALQTIQRAQERSTTPSLRMAFIIHEGQMLAQEQKFREAFDFYSRQLKDFPSSPDLLFGRAVVAESMERLDLAERDLRKILENNKYNWQAMNALGFFLADRNLRLLEAKSWINKALSLSPPNSFEVIDSLGWIEFRLGNLSDAEALLKQAIEIEYNPEVLGHLFETLEQQGKTAEAKKVVHEALERFPGDSYLLRLRDSIR